MTAGNKDSNKPIFIDEDRVDLSKGEFDPQLSFVTMDEAAQTFSISVDKIQFNKLSKIIIKLLDANGYIVNLENILACLDHFYFGIKAKLPSKEVSAEVHSIKYYIPCIQFKLPNKARIGDILNMFYKEVKGYEENIYRLTKGNKIEESEKLEKENSKLKKENSKLSLENSSLLKSINDLSKTLTKYKRGCENDAKSIATQSLLPHHLRLATVAETNINNRSVIFKFGRKHIQTSFALLKNEPKCGDQYLIHIDDGNIIDLFYYGNEKRPFTTRLGEILFVNNEGCKIRDIDRNTYTFSTQNEIEKSIIGQFKRGNKVLLSLIETTLIKIEHINSKNTNHFISRVQEAIVTRQVSDAYLDSVLKDTEKTVHKDE